MDKFDLINVFLDTKKFSDGIGNSVTTRHSFREIKKVETSDYKDNIKVINLDSVSAVVEYSKHGKTCVLNMASAKHAGGGVANGARAQEECLFRCSNLYHTVTQNFYPLIENQCLYTNDAIFFKDVNYEYMDNVVADVVTIAAINLNRYANYDDLQVELDYFKVTRNKIRLMLSQAIDNQVDNIVLGSWGCGVFKNEPEQIASMFREILVNEGYGTYFKNVVFAIINDRNSIGNNYEIFKNILE